MICVAKCKDNVKNCKWRLNNLERHIIRLLSSTIGPGSRTCLAQNVVVLNDRMAGSRSGTRAFVRSTMTIIGMPLQDSGLTSEPCVLLDQDCERAPMQVTACLVHLAPYTVVLRHHLLLLTSHSI